ncbi:YIP1 family protein [Paracoccus sp. p4-l81]|uniref:YIP1 family protein n=1 Tax=Paracoccus sp. p4-l81 TaxID=3342806 RepID=UPI0035B7ECE8
MAFGFDDFLTLSRDAVTRPAQAVPRILNLAPPVEGRWMAAAVVVALSAILAWLASQLFPVPVDTPWSPLTRSPLTMAGVQLVVLIVVSGMVARVGQLFGGKGSFADALWLIVWIDAMMLVIQVAQVLLMLIFPLTAEVLGLVAVGLFFWLVVSFTKELHGFAHIGLVAIGAVGTLIVASLILSLALASLGILPPLEAMPQ